jgi:hypothetical protein
MHVEIFDVELIILIPTNFQSITLLCKLSRVKQVIDPLVVDLNERAVYMKLEGLLIHLLKQRSY